MKNRGLIVVALALVSLPRLSPAQSTTAAITGQVADQSKAVIVDARVTAINNNTNVRYEGRTNKAGAYFIPNISPGDYRIEVGKIGFRTIVKPGITLHVQDTIEMNFEMAVGSFYETMTVEAGAPRVNTTDGSVGTVIDRNFISSLPLNGRDIQSLILLTPGVTLTTQSAADIGTLSVNGQRASTNSFAVDGVSANISAATVSNLQFFGSQATSALGGAYPGTNAFGATNSLVSIDALEEFKIQTSTYTAESGRQPGGQISLVTRSGSNLYHGSLFEYFRNDALDARDFFNQEPARKPALRQNQFGGTFSGPILKNKTFFFFSYEGQRLRLPLSGIVYVPSVRVRQEAAAAVQPLLNANPQPTGPETLIVCDPSTDPTCPPSGMKPSGVAPYSFGLSNPSTMNATSIRIDHTVSTKLTLFGRFNESPSSATLFAGAQGGFANVANTRTLTLGANVLFTPNLNNELRFNYSRQLGQQEELQATYGGAVPPSPDLYTYGLEGNGSVTFLLGGNLTGGGVGDFQKNYQRQINIVDSVSFAKGSHQLKVGIDYRRLSPTFAVLDSRNVSFESEASIESGVADFASVTANDLARPRFINVSAYGQDTWKIVHRLTLDLGLRWEVNPAPIEETGQMPAVALGIKGNPPNYSNATLAPRGTPFYRTFYTAFAPRFGAAYEIDQTSRHETVLRGGFGVYYDLGSAGATSGYPITAFKFLASVPFPLSADEAAAPVPTVPRSLPITNGTTVYSNNQNLALPYTLQWNVALERALGTQQSVSFSYVASAARRLLTEQILNQPSSFTQPPPNPNFASILFTWNGPTSDYESFQAQYKARFGSGLQALTSYTWSHAIDEVSQDANPGILVRGNADFDVRHNFSGAITYTIPAFSAGPALHNVLRNWSVDAIVHASTGRPIDIVSLIGYIGGVQVNVRPDVVPGQPFYIHDPTVPGKRRFNSAAFTSPPVDPNTGLALRQGDFGRNVLRQLALLQADFAAGRTFSLTEKVKLEFKGELFNFFNHPMFGNYQTDYTNPSTFGVPTATLADSLGGLSPLYQLGGPRSVQLSLRLSF